MVNTIPKAFFAYPSRSPTLKEAIHVAVPELNKKGQVKIKTWEECNIGGKFVINTICDAINEAKLFFADLTGLNANVMFELGYAVARDKRIWLIFDETYTEEKKMFDQLKVLTTIGYVPCCNSANIVSGFYKDKRNCLVQFVRVAKSVQHRAQLLATEDSTHQYDEYKGTTVHCSYCRIGN